jgi:cob(I)alamin adenosyltransferase
MKLYTKTGDHGETGLISGKRVPKDDHRVSSYGDVDELNAVVGWLAVAASDAWRVRLAGVQDRLFVMGAELANDRASEGVPAIGEDDVKALEQWIDEATAAVLPLKHFVLPGGCELSARCHLARTVSRRAERTVVALSHSVSVGEHVVPYLNRLSDLFFALGRWANRLAGVDDVSWIPRPKH